MVSRSRIPAKRDGRDEAQKQVANYPCLGVIADRTVVAPTADSPGLHTAKEANKMSDSPAAPATTVDAVDEPSWQAVTRELDDTIDDLMATVVRLLKMVKAIPEAPAEDA